MAVRGRSSNSRDGIIPLQFQGGLDEYQEASMVSPGFVPVLENLVPEKEGNLRCRRGWRAVTTSGAPSPRKCRGIGLFSKYSPYAVPSLRQIGGALSWSTGTSSTASSTWTAANTVAGSLLLAALRITGSATATTPGGWTLAQSKVNGTDTIYLYYIANAPAQSLGTGPSITLSGSANWQLVLAEVVNIGATSPVDQTTTSSGTGTAADSGTTGATVQASEYAVAVLGSVAANINTPTNGFTQVVTDSGTAYFDKVLTATGSVDCGATLNNPVVWEGLVVTFKAAFVAANVSKYLVANDAGAGYGIYAISTGLSGSFALLETVAVADSTGAVAFCAGLQNVFYTHPLFSTTRRYDGTSVASVAGAPAGKCIAYHQNRVFVGGSQANPSRLWYSALGDYTSWPATNYVDVGLDDGEPLEEIIPARGGLAIGKKSSLWFLSGDPSTTSSELQRLTGGGVAPGRTLAMTPQGVIAAGVNSVWLWQYSFYSTSAVEEISGSVPSYGLSSASSFMSSSFVDRQYHVLDQASGLMWVLNLDTGAWRKETANKTADAPGVLFTYGNRQLMGPNSSTTISLLAYRDLPGGSRARDDNVDITYKATTAEMWLGGAGSRVIPKHLYVEVRQRGGALSEATAAINVTPIYDGVAKTVQTIPPQDNAPKTFRVKLDLGAQEAKSVQFQFVQTVTSSQASIMDIERVELEVMTGLPAV